MPKSSGDSGPLSGYKFSINDFTDTQLYRFKLTRTKFGRGNNVFKDFLCQEILLQEKERRRFFWKVADIKLKQDLATGLKKVLGKLNLAVPESLASCVSSNKQSPGDGKCPPTMDDRHWQQLETEYEAASKELSDVNSLLCMPESTEKLSTFEQLKVAFLPQFNLEEYSRFECTHTYNIQYVTRTALLSSVLMSGLLGAEYGFRYINQFDRTKASKYFQTHHDIYFERYRMYVKGFFPAALRWGWRCFFVMGSTLLISQAMTIGRKKDTMMNYLVGAAVPGALFKWKRGPKGMLVSSVLFTCVFGLPLGFFSATCGLNPRTNIYRYYYVPYISSPSHWLNWTKEQKVKNKILTDSILKEMTCKKSYKEAISSQLYRELLPRVWPAPSRG